MNQKRVILIGGGARSGKSDLALRLAQRLGPRRLFIATAEARDDEMRARIGQHRRERGPDFETIEEPIEVATVLERCQADVVVFDCLTLWISNLLCRGDAASEVLDQVDTLARVLERRRCSVVVVTNEVGMSLVPENALGRTFRDVTGMAHRRLSAMADDIYFGVLGTILRLKPGAVRVVSADTGNDADTGDSAHLHGHGHG